MVSDVLFYALCIAVLVGLYIAMRKDPGMGLGLTVTALVVGAALTFAGIVVVPWGSPVGAGLAWAYGLVRGVQVLGGELPVVPSSAPGPLAAPAPQIPPVEQITEVGGGVYWAILAFVGVLLLIGFVFALRGNREVRLPLGGVLLVVGLLLATYGFLNLHEIDEERAALDAARAQASQVLDLRERIGDARLQVLGGVGAVGVGMVFLAWMLVPPGRDER